MDPNEVLREFVANMKIAMDPNIAGSPDAIDSTARAADAMSDLYVWFKRGGFHPDWEILSELISY